MLQKFRTYQLSVQFYRHCETLRLPAHLRDQLLRASSSVTLNIAEGSGKPTPKEQSRYYGIALGSLRECQAALELGRVTNLDAIRLADQLGACLYVLSRKKAAG